MTDLTKAIETVQLLVPPDETPWQVSWIPDEAQTAIFYAVASGEMMPATDAKLAVAEAYRRVAQMALDGTLPLIDVECHDAIRALADTDALAELQALRVDRDKWFGLALDNKHRAEAAEAELAATQAKLARAGKTAANLAEWCYEKADPDEDLRDILFELNAAIEGAKP